jgi:hypothetical protein
MNADTDLIQVQLQPGPDDNLTPQRLSAFYRSVGGDDFVFRELGHPGLSLMYRTLGCFHSLQPTASASSAFDSPSVPCLLIPGFVRWQTLQLLMHPDEHAQCMQKAVELYDIPKPDGGLFPKTIPRESFPSKPDEAMEKWHNDVLERLDEGQNRLKNSPYCSPYEAPDRGEGYFPRNSPHMRRTSRPPRTDAKDLPHHLSTSARRRSSVPSVPSPVQPPDPADTNYHWASDQAFSAPNSALPRSPRHRPSASITSPRPPSQPHHRSSNSYTAATTNNTSAKSFNLNFENFHLPFPFSSKKSRERSSTSAARTRPRPRSSIQSEAVSTGSEASSEDSFPPIPRYEQGRRRSSLAPPGDYNRYQRRHSHDASYLQNKMNRSSFPPRSQHSHNDHNQAYHPYVPSAAPCPPLFRDDLFDETQRTSSAPHSPVGGQPNPKLRVIDPLGRDQSGERGRERRHHAQETLQERRAVSAERRSRSGDRRGGENPDQYRGGANRDRLDMSRQGIPLRVNTVSGPAGGKRARNPEVRSAGIPNLRRVPPMTLSGGGRR